MPENLEDKLNALKDGLQRIEQVIEEKTKEKNILKSEIANLEKINSEMKQIVSAFGQAKKIIDNDATNIGSYFESRNQIIADAIEDAKKEEINAKIGEVDSQISNMTNDLSKIKTAVDDASSIYDKAKAKRDVMQGKYYAYKIKQKEIEDNLKNLKEFKVALDKEQDAGKMANMYFYIRGMENLLNKTRDDIVSFEKNLKEAFENLDAAEIDLRKNAATLEIAKSDLDRKQKELDEAIKNRSKVILDKLQPYNK